MEKQLEQIDSSLVKLDKDQAELLQWALKGFPEKTIVTENDKINSSRTELQQRKVEIGSRIEAAIQAPSDIQRIKEACDLVSKNLTELSLDNKRFALEALNIRVWINRDDIRIEGTLPINDDVIATTRSRPHLSPGRQPCLLAE